MKLKPEIELWYSKETNSVRIVYSDKSKPHEYLYLDDELSDDWIESTHLSDFSPKFIYDFIKIGEL